MLSTSTQKMQMGKRQPLTKVELGGSNGRAKTLHGGIAAKSGGANARGTGKKPADPWYLDATYTRNMAGHTFGRDTALANVKRGLEDSRFSRKRSMRDLGRDYRKARVMQMASHGARGLGSSGINNRAIRDMSTQYNSSLQDIGKQYTSAVAALSRQAELARQQYAAARSGEIGIAKQRWEYLNPGMAPPRR